MRVKLLTLLIVLIIGGNAVSTVTAAIWASDTVDITCTAVVANAELFVLNRDNSATGIAEFFTFSAVDGAGTVLFEDSGVDLFGPHSYTGSAYTTLPVYNPITFRMISPAGNGLEEQLVYSQTGNCAGLPTYTPPPTESSSGCELAIPAGSVVGEAPNGAQIYYAPGQATNLTLNPGTYIVISQDDSETYYKIVLACQFIWVRKDTMQPSNQPPQNGAPLP